MRVGTVTAATVPLLAPTIHAFRDTHPATQVEILSAQQTGIHRALLEGSMDLGLVNYLEGDDMPPEFESTELLRGRPVVCLRPDDELASSATVRTADLWEQPLIAMRAGYVMHRYVMRLLDGREPTFSYSADGAEMGKLMVAAGLGVAVLPDYSVIGDPLERSRRDHLPAARGRRHRRPPRPPAPPLHPRPQRDLRPARPVRGGSAAGDDGEEPDGGRGGFEGRRRRRARRPPSRLGGCALLGCRRDAAGAYRGG